MVATTKILPVGLSFIEWATFMRENLGNESIPLPTNDWRKWFNQVKASNPTLFVPIPTPLAYPNDEDWRKIASLFLINL